MNDILIKGKLSSGAPLISSLKDREMCIVLPDGDLYVRINSATLLLLGGNGKVSSDSPNFTGIPSAPTAANGTNTQQIATTQFVQSVIAGLSLNNYATTTQLNDAINSLINSAPGLLNTLSEIATALGNDSNFATTITTALSEKLDANSIIDCGTIA